MSNQPYAARVISIYRHDGVPHEGTTHFTRKRCPDAELSSGGVVGDKNALKTEERAFLMQLTDNYQRFHAAWPELGFDVAEKGEKPGCGENVTATGLTIENTCVGDVFMVYGTEDRAPAVLEVSCPRLPCKRWDAKYETVGLKEKSMRTFVMHNSIGGVFFRVKREGKILEGDNIVLQHRPHPEWTIAKVGQMLYGSVTGREKTIDDEPKWAGSIEELKSFRNLECLAIQEWKDVAEDLLAEMEDREPEELTRPKRLWSAKM